MSAIPSITVRDEVHAELTALLTVGGPLTEPPPAIANYVGRVCEDSRIRQELADRYRAESVDAPREGLAAVVTAGPPGAGKSTFSRGLATEHRQIDPDEIKDLILERLAKNGLLQILNGHLLSDGRPVQPREVAGWVHQASTAVADTVLAESLRIGENVLMEGTLSWERLPDRYVRQLVDREYEHLAIIDVEVPQATAISQARERWWAGREGHPGGGRYVSDATIGSYYRNTAISYSAANARRLYMRSRDVGIVTDLYLVHRNETHELGAHLDSSGMVDTLPGRAVDTIGSLCVGCGTELSASETAALGSCVECALAPRI